MSCNPIKTKANTTWWYAGISIKHITLIPLGPTRKSLSKAKEDAVRIAIQALLNYKAGLDKELKNFDLLEV